MLKDIDGNYDWIIADNMKSEPETEKGLFIMVNMPVRVYLKKKYICLL